MLLQNIFCRLKIKHPAVYIVQEKMEPVLHFLCKRAAQKSLVADQLRRRKARRFIEYLCCCLYAGKFCCLEFPCRHIADRNAVSAAAAENRKDVIVFRFVQNRVIQHRPRRYNANNLPPDNALCRLRVLRLFTDGHLVALFHQPGDIPVRRMERHAAHRRAFLLSPVFSRQGNFQFL